MAKRGKQRQGKKSFPVYIAEWKRGGKREKLVLPTKVKKKKCDRVHNYGEEERKKRNKKRSVHFDVSGKVGKKSKYGRKTGFEGGAARIRGLKEGKGAGERKTRSLNRAKERIGSKTEKVGAGMREFIMAHRKKEKKKKERGRCVLSGLADRKKKPGGRG